VGPREASYATLRSQVRPRPATPHSHARIQAHAQPDPPSEPLFSPPPPAAHGAARRQQPGGAPGQVRGAEAGAGAAGKPQPHTRPAPRSTLERLQGSPAPRLTRALRRCAAARCHELAWTLDAGIRAGCLSDKHLEKLGRFFAELEEVRPLRGRVGQGGGVWRWCGRSSCGTAWGCGGRGETQRVPGLAHGPGPEPLCALALAPPGRPGRGGGGPPCSGGEAPPHRQWRAAGRGSSGRAVRRGDVPREQGAPEAQRRAPTLGSFPSSAAAPQLVTRPSTLSPPAPPPVAPRRRTRARARARRRALAEAPRSRCACWARRGWCCATPWPCTCWPRRRCCCCM
jgi:hypothetical protein